MIVDRLLVPIRQTSKQGTPLRKMPNQTASVITTATSGAESASSVMTSSSSSGVAQSQLPNRKAQRIVLPGDSEANTGVLSPSNSKPKFDEAILNSVMAKVRTANVNSNNDKRTSISKTAVNTPGKGQGQQTGVRAESRPTRTGTSASDTKKGQSIEQGETKKNDTLVPSTTQMDDDGREWARIPEGFSVITPDDNMSVEDNEARARELGETMAAAWRSKLAATDAQAAQKKKHKNRQAAGVCDNEVAGNSGTAERAGSNGSGQWGYGYENGNGVCGGKQPEDMTTDEVLYWHRYYHTLAVELYKRYAAMTHASQHQQHQQIAEQQIHMGMAQHQQHQAPVSPIDQQLVGHGHAVALQENFMMDSVKMGQPLNMGINFGLDSFDDYNSPVNDLDLSDVNPSSYLQAQMQHLGIASHGHEWVRNSS